MKEDWKKNFRILWFGSLITGMGNAMTLPFIVLFIDTLGNFNNTELNFLGAAAFSLTYLSKAIVSPLWGRLADLKGRKKFKQLKPPFLQCYNRYDKDSAPNSISNLHRQKKTNHTQFTIQLEIFIYFLL